MCADELEVGNYSRQKEIFQVRNYLSRLIQYFYEMKLLIYCSTLKIILYMGMFGNVERSNLATLKCYTLSLKNHIEFLLY